MGRESEEGKGIRFHNGTSFSHFQPWIRSAQHQNLIGLVHKYSIIRQGENRFTTFRVILLVDRQTNKQTNRAYRVRQLHYSLAEIR